MRKYVSRATLFLALFSSSALADTAPAAHQVEIVGPGTISTEAPEFATSLSSDGNTLYFNRMPADRSTIHIFVSERGENGWSPAAKLAFSDDRYRDVDPFLSADGARLYFSSNRPTTGVAAKEDYDIWYVEKSARGWGAPVNAGPTVNSKDTEIYSTLTRDNMMYFSVFRGENREASVYASKLENGTFKPRQPVSIPGSDKIRFTNPTISPDGALLVLSAAAVNTIGGADLYLAKQLPDGGWSRPELLPASINSPFTEFAPHLFSHNDSGMILYFTSERPGLVGPQPDGVRPPGDIYRARLH